MNIRQYIEQMKEIQSHILNFLDKDISPDEHYSQLIKIFDQNKSQRDRYGLNEILILISKIYKNHHHKPGFFSKIGRVLLYFKDEIKQTYSNNEIYHLFRNCNYLLLILYKNGLLVFDEALLDVFEIDGYKNTNLVYFYKELKPFLGIKIEDEEEEEEENDNDDNSFGNFNIEKIVNDNFEEKREIGENESYLCKIIREDNLKEFILYQNRTNLDLNKRFIYSIFETNSFLITKLLLVVEYAAFHGSLNIVNYLHNRNVKFIPFLLQLAVYSGNVRLIHFLEEIIVVNETETYNKMLKIAIKCHYNDIAYYILNNYIIDKVDVDVISLPNVAALSFRYHNYLLFPDDIENKACFTYACQNNYLGYVKNVLENPSINIKNIIITSFNYHYKICLIFINEIFLFVCLNEI